MNISIEPNEEDADMDREEVGQGEGVPRMSDALWFPVMGSCAISMDYRKLSDEEIALYTEEMNYRKDDISEELFEQLFEFNYDCNFRWFNGMFYHLYGEPSLESPIVENYVDDTYQTLNYKTWRLNEQEKKEFIGDMDEKNISIERKLQYINGFPFVSAIVVPVEWNFDYTKTIEKYGFYPGVFDQPSP